jgi:HSP20 family protein
MITVTLKHLTQHDNSFFSEPPAHYVTRIANWRLASQPNTWRPSTDAYETEDNLIVRVDISGMKEDDFLINVDQGTLTISGTRQDTSERKAFHQMEIHFGDFSTEVKFTIPVEIDKVHAEYHNGILWVTMPKSFPKQINILKK